MNLFKKIFKKRIEKEAQSRLKEIALEKYINENFFLGASNNALELQFRGKTFIKLMAASVYELVKDADNYVVMDLNSAGMEPLVVTIQKRWKLSPHEKAKKLEKQVEELKAELAGMKGKSNDDVGQH